MPDTKRWSHEDTLEELQAFYFLYHMEILGYKPTWYPTDLTRGWLIAELEAFDWYSDYGNFRYEVLEQQKSKPQEVTKSKPKSKPKSPFGDES